MCDLLYILHAFLAALVWSQLIFNCQSVRVGLALNFHNFHLSKVGKFATVCLGPDCKTGHKALQGYSPRKSAKLQDNRANLYTFLISGAWKMRVASKPYQSPTFCSAWLRRYPFRYGGGPFRPPLLENRDFSGTEPMLDLRPVCKFKFVLCGPVGKNQSALSFWV